MSGGDRPIHASFKTKSLPRHWEATFDGRWLHVRDGDSFANTIEAVTCGRCRTYIEDDAEAVGVDRYSWSSSTS